MAQLNEKTVNAAIWRLLDTSDITVSPVCRIANELGVDWRDLLYAILDRVEQGRK